MSLRSHLAGTYFSIDPRTLGLFRIWLGVTLLVNLFFRARVYEVFYSNEGLLPNHTILWAPPSPKIFSLFFTLSTPAEAAAGMVICGLVFVALIAGWQTKLFQILTFVCFVSLNSRIAPLENGGDRVLNILVTLTMFLPLGRRFSIDSVLASMRRRVEHQPRDLADRAAMRLPSARVISIVVCALILQLGLIYLFNAAHKSGRTWIEDFSSVHYTLQQDRIVTRFGVWLREHASAELLQGLTAMTIVVEALGALLVLSPFAPVWTRAIAIVMMPCLHLGFSSCIRIGSFSDAMALFFVLLLHERHWAWLYGFMQRHTQKRVVFYDSDCGICFWIARLLARLDLLHRLELRSNQDGLPESVAAGRQRDTLIVQNLATGRVYERARSVAEVLYGLPMGFAVAWVLRIPGLHLVFGVLYDLVAKNRTKISSFVGLNACGMPGPSGSAELHLETPSDARRTFARGAVALRELAALVVILSIGGDMINANAAVPAALRFEQPASLRAIMDYVRMYQGWRMFAPEAPLGDVHVSVEATTVEGRLVDPYNEVASRVWSVPLKGIPERIQNDQYFTTYSLFIPEPRFRMYITAFEQWVMRYHLRTGDPKDRIVKFVAYKLTDESPPPGQTKTRNFRRTVFLRYPK